MAWMRAAQLKEDLVALGQELGPEVERRVLADVPAETIGSIQAATRIEWLPIEVHEILVRAVRTHAGDEGLRAWARAAALRSAASRLFGPIVEPLVRMFGLKPNVVLRVPPVAYPATFRGLGELKALSSEPQRVRFALRGLPPVVDRQTFFVVMAGAVESALVHSRVEGRVEILPGEGGADCILEARWPVARADTGPRRRAG